MGPPNNILNNHHLVLNQPWSLRKPMGYSHFAMENGNFSWENPLFLWPFSIAFSIAMLYPRFHLACQATSSSSSHPEPFYQWESAIEIEKHGHLAPFHTSHHYFRIYVYVYIYMICIYIYDIYIYICICIYIYVIIFQLSTSFRASSPRPGESAPAVTGWWAHTAWSTKSAALGFPI